MDEFYVCRQCIKVEKIINHLERLQSRDNMGICSICGKKLGINICNNNELLQDIVDAIRFHYSYNQYGMQLISLKRVVGAGLFAPMFLVEENEIFRDKLDSNTAYEFMVVLLKKTDLGDVSIFTSSEKNGAQSIYKLFLDSHATKPLKYAESLLINNIKSDLNQKNDYEIEEKYVLLFREILDFLPQVNIYDKVFYRAREGGNKEQILLGKSENEIRFPYIDKEVLAPPPCIASAGRFNREGCSFLYVASKDTTAIAEIKSYVGQICTVAEILCKDESVYLDFRGETLKKEENRCEIIKLNIMYSFKNLFSIPVQERKDYLITQFIADIFRKIGIGGIIYDSVQTEGYNVMSFNSSLYECVSGSEKMVLLKKVTYEVEELRDERKNYIGYKFKRDEANRKYEFKQENSINANYDFDIFEFLKMTDSFHASGQDEEE